VSKLAKSFLYADSLLGQELVGAACPSKGVSIQKCAKAQADEIVTKQHYSHKPVQNSFLSFLVYHNGAVGGALQLGYGIRPAIKEGYRAETVREFDRMWLSDSMPKFSETIVISLLIKYLRAATNIKHLISYCDTSVGNNGTIYRAANFRQIDRIKADFYILASGERVHPVSMYHRHGTRAFAALEAIYPGIRKADGWQLKFVFDL